MVKTPSPSTKGIARDHRPPGTKHAPPNNMSNGACYAGRLSTRDGSADQLPTVATPASDITIERLFTVGSQTAHWWKTDIPVNAGLLGTEMAD